MSPPSRRTSTPEVEDERKLKRKLANRESSRRCRERKQQKLLDLLDDATRFKAENEIAEDQIAAYTAQLAKVDAENAELRALHGQLAGKLQALEDALELRALHGQLRGDVVDIIIPEVAVDPLPCPCPSPFTQQLQPADSAMADVFPF